MRPRTRPQTAKPFVAIVMYVPFVIKPVAVPPPRLSVCPSMGLSGGKITVFSHHCGGFTPNLRKGAIEKHAATQGLWRSSANKYMFFNVYFSERPIAALSRKSATKTNAKSKAPGTAMTPAAKPALLCPFKVVASCPERAYRGGGTIVFKTNPCFEGRI